LNSSVSATLRKSAGQPHYEQAAVLDRRNAASNGCLAWFCSSSSGVRDRRTPDYATRQMVAREGSAPPTSGCRPDAILFHHRAEFGCLAWIRTKTNGVKARHAAVTPRDKDLVEPEVVATSPYRIKSPVPVCCGFDSLKLVGERGLAPPRLTDSRSVGSAIPA
jgi:hypothetical protein